MARVCSSSGAEVEGRRGGVGNSRAERARHPRDQHKENPAIIHATREFGRLGDRIRGADEGNRKAIAGGIGAAKAVDS